METSHEISGIGRDDGGSGYQTGGEGNPLKTAIVHDWLVTYAGAERALEQIIALYPEADLYSLVDFIPDDQRCFLSHKKAKTSFIQSLPFARTRYRSYLPLMPLAIEQFDLRDYGLIISSSHAVAKGVMTHPRQKHVCYCYTPIRYAWDLKDQYLHESGLDKGLKGLIARSILNYIRRWDRRTADRVDHYIAISHYIADRIKRAYGRDAVVIYPPVDIDSFIPGTEKKDFYLTASRMVPYKKVNLIVEAFSLMPEKKLVVIGDGPDFDKIKTKAGKNVELLGFQSSREMLAYMQKARAFVYAADEDFGIVTVEAQACATPVIAFGRGGSLETVIPLQVTTGHADATRGTGHENLQAPTGVFYYEQTVEALKNAVCSFENNMDKFNPEKIRANAVRFSTDRFSREFKCFVDRSLQQVFS
jgi:glycosyltransferase involved in cell wall biosynthesis